MSNIELYGIVKGDPTDVKIRGRLKQTLSQKAIDNIVFTYVKSEVEDIYGNKKPYIRVVDPDKEKAQMLVGLLEGLVDTEFLVIGGFTSAEEKKYRKL